MRGRWRWAALASPLALAALLASGWAPGSRVDVTFLAVGHGDAIVITSGGHAALIDGGGVPNGHDTGRRFVLPFLRQRRVDRLDLAALSHAHPDHALGLASVLEEVPTARLWLPADVGRGPLVAALLDASGDAEVHEVEAGDPALEVGAAKVEILGPPGDRTGLGSENDRSLVLLVRHGEVTFLLPGDVEAAGEATIDPGSVTVMKAPHHGSDTSSTPELLGRVTPRHVVFCVGLRNRFHFPKPEVVERYSRLGARCYRTDVDGAITFHSDGHEVTVETVAPRLLHARRQAEVRAEEP
jgi:competence protein ComEC